MEEKQITPEAVPQWQLDLDKVGFVRKLFLARKWYGGDWWFVAVSAVLLLFIILLGVAPKWFAPYDPRAEVGPALLSPGEIPLGYVLVVQADSTVTSLKEIGTNKNNIGYVVGSAASQALRDTIDELNAAEKAAGSGITYQPRPRRYETNDLGLADLQDGKLDAFVASMEELTPLLPKFPGVKVAGNLTGNTKTFTLGTNQLGQDVLSRIIWGTRIALIVGLSSAIISFLLGVPLGLISGFIGGPFDRVLTMLMDSLYSFPGLILAIAIAAVLGAGIGNIIVAIAVLYIPTYFRIVRGQTLSVKNDLYVEAARSLGTPPWQILTKYILPNVIPSVVIIFSVNVADAILTEAGLSFLGLGLPPDTPDWGIDLSRGQDYIRRAWWLITFPGVMVSLVTLSFSMLGESLAEILNPRLAEL
ncbi:ABC-type dipeptide/oligopeptide/nickel transport system, permease component [Longilinea arvoryzae]|uniref:ABC-type dipeptide/oligopeptide/nickel transport system, permease component n=1 Tax=Longilinea arvoryzae TaxID=360412 RepID=A0A0S7BCJ2_9CHLR|nr:ABC transporter permease subunit [Longilinea arvoryzae]GAP13005.1 ABC-type dipeptide/oligopeptide/nickel transport system, permease component [Longilinea arvoryzae]